MKKKVVLIVAEALRPINVVHLRVEQLALHPRNVIFYGLFYWVYRLWIIILGSSAVSQGRKRKSAQTGDTEPIVDFVRKNEIKIEVSKFFIVNIIPLFHYIYLYRCL